MQIICIMNSYLKFFLSIFLQKIIISYLKTYNCVNYQR